MKIYYLCRLAALGFLFCVCISGCAASKSSTSYGEHYYQEARAYYDAKEYDKALDVSTNGQLAIAQKIRDCEENNTRLSDCEHLSGGRGNISRLQTIQAWVHYIYGQKDWAFQVASSCDTQECTLLMGRIHAERGNYEDAANIYFTMVGKPVWPIPPARSGDIEMARPLFSLLAPDDATLTERIKKNPSMPQLYRLRGLLRESMGQQALAIKDYTTYLQKDECPGLGERGMALMRAGKYKEAYNDFDRLVKKCGIRHSSYYYRGLASQYLGNLDEALADYNYRPINMNKTWTDLEPVYVDLQICVVHVRKGSTTRNLNIKMYDVINRMPQNVEARTTHILYLIREGYMDGAKRSLEEFRAFNPRAAEEFAKSLRDKGLMK